MSHQPMSTPICKLVRIKAQPGLADRLHQALMVLETATRSEVGCVEFAFFRALSDQESFVLLEHFVDEAALAFHMAQPHTREFFAAQLVASVKAIDVSAVA